MTRWELAAALFAAMAATGAAGWALHALWRRLGGGRDRELAELAARTEAGETAAAAALARAAETEARVTGASADTEAALRRQLAERQAELEAAMETVGVLRRRLAEAEARAPGP